MLLSPRSFSESMMRNIRIFFFLLFILPPIWGQKSHLRNVAFKLYDQRMSWKEAQSVCRKNHTDLATIRSKEDNKVSDSFWRWIGLYKDDKGSPWKWSGGDEYIPNLIWNANEPDVEDDLCADINTGELYSADCQVKLKFMCSDENLVVVKENKTWEEALDHCRSLGGEDSGDWKPSYDLVTLITEEDHDYARGRAQQATTDEVWTGLRFLGDGWFWVGGEAVQYPDIPGCPASGCGVLEKNSTASFGIRACSQRRNFFCSRRP